MLDCVIFDRAASMVAPACILNEFICWGYLIVEKFLRDPFTGKPNALIYDAYRRTAGSVALTDAIKLLKPCFASVWLSKSKWLFTLQGL
jgi:hypothetical protein